MSPTPSQKEPRSHRNLLLLIPILLSLAGFTFLFYNIRSIELHPADGSEGYRIWLRPTRDKQSDSLAKSLRTRLRYLVIGNSTARLLPGSGWKAMGDSLQDSAGNSIVQELILTRPGDTFRFGGYHRSTVFTVKQITTESLTLTYSHTFMGNNGFGGHLVTEDIGEFTLVPFGSP